MQNVNVKFSINVSLILVILEYIRYNKRETEMYVQNT